MPGENHGAVGQIATGLLALITHPDQLAVLRAEPDLTSNVCREFILAVPVEEL